MPERREPEPHTVGGVALSENPTPRGRHRWFRLVGQVVLLAIVLTFAGRQLVTQWRAVAESASVLRPDWLRIALSSAVVLSTYALLVESWRMLIRAGGGALRYGPAVRIWTISNLGRYVPGKVWSIGAMGVLAKQEGVSGLTAAGAAILGTLLNIGAGFGVTALAAMGVQDRLPRYIRMGAIVGSVAFVAGLLLLPRLLPLVARWYARLRRAPVTMPQIPVRALWMATAINVGSWIAYGSGFALLSQAVTPAVAGNLPQFITVFTASYIAGYLVLIAPGGIGVREVVATTLLQAFGMATPGDAILLVLLSRVWLTVLEIVPGLVALLVSRPFESLARGGHA